MSKALDLRDKKFNYLYCIEPCTDRKGPSIVWKCLCDCGNITYKPADTIKDGRSKSCGCMRLNTKYKFGRGFGNVYSNYVDRCRSRGVVFELDEDQFYTLITSNCTYCGNPPSQSAMRAPNFKYNGIDRIDPGQGYIKGNCSPCCKVCNWSKSNQSLEDFKSWISKVHSHLAL